MLDFKFTVNAWSPPLEAQCAVIDCRVRLEECLTYFCGGRSVCLALPKLPGFVKFSNSSCHKVATSCWSLSPTVGLVASILVEAGAGMHHPTRSLGMSLRDYA